MVYQKKEKIYSTNKTAECMRRKRAEMVKKDPLAMRSTIWVIETADGKQIVFRDKRDIKPYRIPKEQMKADCIKAF